MRSFLVDPELVPAIVASARRGGHVQMMNRSGPVRYGCMTKGTLVVAEVRIDKYYGDNWPGQGRVRGRILPQSRTAPIWDDISERTAESLMELCDGTLDWEQYTVRTRLHGDWTIHVYDSPHEGLVAAAQVESDRALRSRIPDWCNKDITGDSRYFPAQLSLSSNTPPTAGSQTT